MADLTVQDISDEDGAAVTFAAADVAGDKFAYSDKATIVVKNDDVAAKTVTVVAAVTAFNDRQRGELTRSNIVLTVAAGAVAVIPPLPNPFRNASDANKVALTYDAVTSLSIAVIRTA